MTRPDGPSQRDDFSATTTAGSIPTTPPPETAAAVERMPASVERTPAERDADHAAIGRLADDLLPALVAKLGASGLGELEVREGPWRVRLRMQGDGHASRRSAAAGRTGRIDAHGPAASHGVGGQGTGGQGTGGQGAAPAVAAPAPAADTEVRPPTRVAATSPAVGFFRPLPALASGARVRAGDRLGSIDVLGVSQELVAPVDGIVGSTFVEPDDPVEYGQRLVEIELLDPPRPASRGEAG